MLFAAAGTALRRAGVAADVASRRRVDVSAGAEIGARQRPVARPLDRPPGRRKGGATAAAAGGGDGPHTGRQVLSDLRAGAGAQATLVVLAALDIAPLPP